MQLPKLTPGKRFHLPRPVGSADALLLARLGEREKGDGRVTAIVTAKINEHCLINSSSGGGQRQRQWKNDMERSDYRSESLFTLVQQLAFHS